jgi:hypothetical protein
MQIHLQRAACSVQMNVHGAIGTGYQQTFARSDTRTHGCAHLHFAAAVLCCDAMRCDETSACCVSAIRLSLCVRARQVMYAQGRIGLQRCCRPISAARQHRADHLEFSVRPRS